MSDVIHGASRVRVHSVAPRRAGLTMVEMLVALAASLIMMAAVVTLFGAVSASVTESRAALELSDRMRFAEQRIRADLRGITAPTLPVLKPEAGLGYFEIIEGPMRDYNATAPNPAPVWPKPDSPTPGNQPYANSTIYGDLDDVICFTTRSSTPFAGQSQGVSPGALQSAVAEVIYYLRPNRTPASPPTDLTVRSPTTYALYRRVRLVMPGATGLTQADMNPNTGDVSARNEGGTWKPNSLADLTRRQNRFNHGTSFPYAWVGTTGTVFPNGWETVTTPPGEIWVGTPPSPTVDLTNRQGEEVLINDVVSFDVRVFDPTAPADNAAPGNTFVPGDPGYSANRNYPRLGAFVDLGYEPNPSSSSPPPPYSTYSERSSLGSGLTMPTWDTWPATSLRSDQQSALLDYETPTPPPESTSPPYNHPLRGVQITLRTYDPSTRQIQQRTIVESFIPE